MKNLLSVLVVLVLVGGAVFAVKHFATSREGSDPTRLVLYGNVDIREVELAINGSQRIAKLLVREGDHVQQGDLLAVLDTSRLEPAVTHAAAQVSAQGAAVARLEAGSRVEEIAKARADVAAGESTVRDAEDTYERIAKLVPKAKSQQEADDAREALNSAKSRLKALQATLDLVLAGPRKEDIDEARATLKMYESDLELRRHELTDASLFAPSAGVIRNRMLEVGDMASPQRTVFSLALTNPVWVRAYISETDLGKIWPGMKATVQTDSFSDRTYDGWVGYISPTAEFTPKAVETPDLRTRLVYQVRVFVDNPKDELRLGMPATVTLQLDQPHENAVQASAVSPAIAP